MVSDNAMDKRYDIDPAANLGITPRLMTEGDSRDVLPKESKYGGLKLDKLLGDEYGEDNIPL